MANARKIPGITSSESKNDRNDAEKLSRFAAFDPKLLSPLEHRSEEHQVDLNLIHARSALVRTRTMIINALRGLEKALEVVYQPVRPNLFRLVCWRLYRPLLTLSLPH